jgi:hypothetical protein
MTNNKQQTAVEWLEQEMLKPNLSMKEILEKAKEMEKEQIVKAAQDNFYVGQDLANGCDIEWDSAEDYYNQTYGGGKK